MGYWIYVSGTRLHLSRLEQKIRTRFEIRAMGV